MSTRKTKSESETPTPAPRKRKIAAADPTAPKATRSRRKVTTAPDDQRSDRHQLHSHGTEPRSHRHARVPHRASSAASGDPFADWLLGRAASCREVV